MIADIITKLAGMEQEDHGPYYPRPSLASPATPDDHGRCIRALTYARLEYPAKPWPGRFLLLLDDSSWHEELTMDWLAKSPYRVHSRQMPVDFPLPRPIGTGGFCRRCQLSIPNTVLHGHIDGLFTDLLGAERLLEHKAIGHFPFGQTQGGTPSLDHLTQGCIYLGGVQLLNPDIKEGLLLIKSRNTSAYCEYRFTYDPQTDRCRVFELVASEGITRTLDVTFDGLITRAIEKFELVERHGAANTLPPRPYRMDHWRCDYCLFQARCWDGYAQELAERETNAQIDEAMAPLLADYLRASKAKSEGEATTKHLRPMILAALEAQSIKTGIVNGYRASVSTSGRTTLDPLLIPQKIREAAETNKTIEILKVTRTGEPDTETEEITPANHA